MTLAQSRKQKAIWSFAKIQTVRVLSQLSFPSEPTSIAGASYLACLCSNDFWHQLTAGLAVDALPLIPYRLCASCQPEAVYADTLRPEPGNARPS